MVKVSDIISALDSFAPFSLQESYDNCGLQVGDPSMLSSGVLLAVDLTEEVLDESIDCGLNTIVVHHPPIFRGVKSLVSTDPLARMLVRAIKHDVAIIAAHTNVDKAYGGVSYIMGQKLGLTHMRPLACQGDDGFGLGVVGSLAGSLPVADFLGNVRRLLGCRCLRHTVPVCSEVHTVALCGGSGASLTGDAIKAGADVYVSADFKYHDFFDAAGVVTLVDAGHFETERYVVEIFYDVLTKKFTNFAVRQTSAYTNPVIYLY
ncbi:MAG: Nif3-like dinuclear metal center hexameric protein [Rikenellaceae bacterium]|nr:Nif3-like dinuclear metal center hexameric protein [Rikenellaceae bacterium]MDE7133869.1 Nif3-like dinuclear metal center hexameric protein [Rikenellaceae bacterium]MDE7355451.1 Nif3-like dinuclear metal center hexameric protein [Rikenellaceae bacterium]